MRLLYADFWEGFDEEGSLLTQTLRKHYDVEIVKDKPDILIYSCFGRDNVRFTDGCKRIQYLGENMISDRYADFVIDMDKYDERKNHLYFPLYALNERYDFLEAENKFDGDAIGRKLCSCVVSSPVCGHRNDFIDKMSHLVDIDRYGMLFGNRIDDKYSTISKYRFNLAMENSNTYGYCTEKIVDAFKCGTVPLYWGNEIPPEDFNKDAYIYIGDRDPVDVVDEILSMSGEDYIKMLTARKLNKSAYEHHSNLENFLLNIVEN